MAQAMLATNDAVAAVRQLPGMRRSEDDILTEVLQHALEIGAFPAATHSLAKSSDYALRVAATCLR
jgi:hypothetical protein